MTGAEFRERVERVHAKHTRSTSTHGALTWFGEWCQRTGRSVYEWTTKNPVPEGPHMVVLALLEVAPASSRMLTNIRQELRQWLPS